MVLDFAVLHGYENPKVLESKPNPWLKNPTAEHYEIDCRVHLQSECVVTTLHTIEYGTEGYQAIIAEATCHTFAVWCD